MTIPQCKRSSRWLAVAAVTSLAIGRASGAPVISEFSATGTDLADEDSDTPDWIEVHNPGDSEVALAGWSLSDSPDAPTKWVFPDVVLAPGAYLVVFASGKDRAVAGAELHAGFSIDNAGEYLALFAPGGAPASSEFDPAFPPQVAGLSYGTSPEGGGGYVYLQTPTPGGPNSGEAFDGLVADTKFAVGRGVYAAAFDETITCATPGATIVYTTDGTVPALDNGTQVAAPDAASPVVATVPVVRTGAIRAAAFRDGMRPTNTDTNTYIFPADVRSQTETVTTDDYGFPPRWGSARPDYGMDSDVVGPGDRFGGAYVATVEDDLRAIPSFSLVLPVDDMFGRAGIYTNASQEGIRWERATSAELIHADGSDGFQIDCGVRIQGRASRSNGLSLKNSFRLAFRQTYGQGKLRHDLYGAGATDEFDTLILRMHFNDGWSWGGAGGTPQFLREEYFHRLQLASGHPSPHGRLVHLYINGVYWGLYNLRERPDSRFAASYFEGVEEEDWDGINNGTPVNATDDRSRITRARVAWDTLVQRCQAVADAGSVAERHAAYMAVMGANPDGTNDPTSENYLDVGNYIDYLLLNFWGANADWPGRNWYCGRENSPDSDGFRFFVWDPEISLHCSQGASDVRATSVRQDQINAERTAPVSDRESITVPFHRLRDSEVFRLRFADHAHRMLFNGGILYVEPGSGPWDAATPGRNRPADLYAALAAEVRSPLVAESARWGDQHRSLPYTVNAEWTNERDHMLESWLVDRNAIFMGHLARHDLYPDTAAPHFGQHGGTVPPGFQLVMSGGSDDTQAGTLYYTTDGTDPLQINPDGTFSVAPGALVYDRGGAGIALTEPAVVKARLLDGGEWSALNEAEFVVGAAPTPSTLVVSEVSYRPSPPGLAEVAAGFDRREDFEFIELMNTGGEALDLSDLAFSLGMRFQFGSIPSPLDRTLAPGERAVLVEDAEAFRFRYGPAPRVLGQFEGALSNDGETLRLVSGSSGEVLHEWTYNDQLPWPTCADGDGYSLVLAAPESAPDHGEPANWRCSLLRGGTPGRDDSPVGPADYEVSQVDVDDGGGGGPETYATIEYVREAGTTDPFRVEFSGGLDAWGDESDGAVLLHSEVDLGGGLTLVTWRSAGPVDGDTEWFWRFVE